MTERLRQINWKHLIIGVLLGSIITVVVVKWKHVRWQEMRQDRYQRLLEKFGSKLDLTADQKVKVAAILDVKRQKIDRIRSEVRPRYEEVRLNAREEIRLLLNAEQQKKFEELEKERDERRKKWHKWEEKGK